MRRQLQRRCGSLRSGWCRVAWCWFGWLWTRIWSSVRHRCASIPAGLGSLCTGRRSARRSIVLALRHEVLRGGVVGLGGQHVPALAVEPDADVVEDRVLELTREMATLGIAVTVGDRSPLVSRRHHAAAADRSEGRGGPTVTRPGRLGQAGLDRALGGPRGAGWPSGAPPISPEGEHPQHPPGTSRGAEAPPLHHIKPPCRRGVSDPARRGGR